MIGGARLAFLRAHAAPCVKSEPRHHEHTRTRAQKILFALRDDHDRRHDRRHVLAVARFLHGGFRGVVTGVQIETYARGIATTRDDAIVLATLQDGVRAIRVADAADVRFVWRPEWRLWKICVARDGYVFVSDCKIVGTQKRFCIRVLTRQLEFESTIAETCISIDAQPAAICANETVVIVSFYNYRVDVVIWRRGDGTLLREIAVPDRGQTHPITGNKLTISGLTMLSDQRRFAAYSRYNAMYSPIYVYIYGIEGELLHRVPTEHFSPKVDSVCVAPSGEIATIEGKDEDADADADADAYAYICITDGAGAPLRHKLPLGCCHQIAAALQGSGFVINRTCGLGPFKVFVLE